jgi:hypothetical protein
MNDNKNSYFYINIELDELNSENEFHKEKIENSVDLIFSAMKATDEIYKFEKEGRIISLFKTNNRKRKGKLNKFCERYLPENIESRKIGGLTKADFDAAINRIKHNKKYKIVEEPKLINKYEYKGEDIQIFNDQKSWRPWQKEIYKKIFNKDGKFHKPDPRRIISIVDFTGASGKSSFFKWLYVNHPNDIGRIGYGTSAQLRSSVTNIGPKQLYIIDLSRSKGKGDKEEDLLSILEDIKSGLVINAMYGSGKQLVMDPPHVVVSSNYILNYNLLSKDRWDVYEIKQDFTTRKLDPRQLQRQTEKKFTKK